MVHSKMDGQNAGVDLKKEREKGCGLYSHFPSSTS